MVKRLVDVVIASLLLSLGMPLLLAAALLIVLTSPGPVLFRQVRMGRGFQPFEILKLRTMAHAEAGLAYTLGPDPRITAAGKWLRRTKLDELPQLWNVIRGEMSLVGPRPVLPELTYEFREFYLHLLQARPGLTDPASLKYSQEARLLAQARDPMRYFKTVVTPDKLRISFEYMGKANLWTDTQTMLMTAAICCFPSLSKVYGDVPVIEEAGEEAGEVGAARNMVWAGVAPVTDSVIFSHELAALEAASDFTPDFDPAFVGTEPELPWIRLPISPLTARSSSIAAKESATRLSV